MNVPRISVLSDLLAYLAFAALAFFGGTIYNRGRIKVCLMFGGFGYACLACAYFTTAHIGDRATPWVVLAGCIEGLSAAMVSHLTSRYQYQSPAPTGTFGQWSAKDPFQSLKQH